MVYEAYISFELQKLNSLNKIGINGTAMPIIFWKAKMTVIFQIFGKLFVPLWYERPKEKDNHWKEKVVIQLL